MAEKSRYNYRVEPQDVDFTLRATIPSLGGSILNTAGSLHNYMIARFHFIVLRIEVIDLTYIPKSYAYYFCHSISP